MSDIFTTYHSSKLYCLFAFFCLFVSSTCVLDNYLSLAMLFIDDEKHVTVISFRITILSLWTTDEFTSTFSSWNRWSFSPLCTRKSTSISIYQNLDTISFHIGSESFRVENFRCKRMRQRRSKVIGSLQQCKQVTNSAEPAMLPEFRTNKNDRTTTTLIPLYDR